jgi:23S rRNA (adenine2503-C2)-methyltransferase
MPTTDLPPSSIAAISGAARTDVLGLTFAAFSRYLLDTVGYCERFHRALYRQIMTTGRCQPEILPAWQEAERDVPGICQRISSMIALKQLPEVIHEYSAHDPLLGTTRKLVLRLTDGKQIESVLIPMGGGNEKGGFATVCVSSQVGCRMGCRFCHTATMGLLRHLTPQEIVAQVVAVAAHAGVIPRNVVFMGMGEPLDNLDAVAQAVAVLTDHNGLRVAHRHISISTVGRVDGLARMPALGLNRVNLAVSLSAANDELRSSLMPVNRLYDLATLRAALSAFPLLGARKILISYVLMAGVNDQDAQIKELIDWCRGLNVLVNLIPYNPIPSRNETPTTPQRVDAVQEIIKAAGVHVRVRRTKGDAVMAACGQLGDPAQRQRLARLPG